MPRILAAALLFAWSLCPSLWAEAQSAKEILEASGVRGGLVLHLGCGDGRLTADLAAGPQYVVEGLDADPAHVAAARAYVQSKGLYGRVTIDRCPGERLPYLDGLVNLAVIESPGPIGMPEVLRVLAPGGVAYVRQGGQWTKTVKPWPAEIDQWTHYLHDAGNNAVAHDSLVGPPRGLHWFAEPLYCRTHETDSSVSAMVSAAGRLFYILDEGPIGVADKRLPQTWALLARDAFSGVQLWRVPLPGWGWPEWKGPELAAADWATIKGNRLRSPVTLPRRLVCDGPQVYVTLGFHAPVTVLDAACGTTLRTLAGTEDTDEILSSGGTLVLCVRKEHVSAENSGSGERKSKKADRKPGKRDLLPAGTTIPTTDRLLAVDPQTGRILWRSDPCSITQLTPAVDDGRVFFLDGEHLVCLDLAGGTVRWRAECPAAGGRFFSSSDTLVASQGVVLVNGQDLRAFAADSGKPLWSGRASKGPGVSNAPDLFLAGGLVWDGGDLEGRNPQTGSVEKTLQLEKLINPWHHYRCYRSKATDHYLIWPKQGAEFIDLVAHDNMRHDWFRGPCKYGVLPCNGLLYSGPHQCSCFAGVKLNGFNALSAQSAVPAAAETEGRLERGPAYDEAQRDKGAEGQRDKGAEGDEWPTFRHDALRSGSSAAAVAAGAGPLWQTPLGGKLSQPVIAGGKLLVASIDAHQVYCLDAQDGRRLWSFTAGARIDSPPTICGGRALFGSADGWVYCLRSADGQLAWRYRLAPAERRLVALDQVESVWPVHGSVLVQKGVAYAVAGRSSFLDGGLFLAALDPASGKLLHEARLEGPYPDVHVDDGGSRDMPGARSDVLVGDGESVYLRQVKFDAALKQQGTWGPRELGGDPSGAHLMTTTDLLDGAEFNRTCWSYGPNWSSAQGGGDTGQILVFDRQRTYAAQVYSKHVAQSLVYFPGEQYVRLFAVSHSASSQEPAPAKKRRPAASAAADSWSLSVPVYARAMTLAGGTLLVAGLPDELDPADPLSVLAGRRGGVLWAASAEDGHKLAESKLDSAPVWDGLIAAGGRLYLATVDGQLRCWGKGE